MFCVFIHGFNQLTATKDPGVVLFDWIPSRTGEKVICEEGNKMWWHQVGWAGMLLTFSMNSIWLDITTWIRQLAMTRANSWEAILFNFLFCNIEVDWFEICKTFSQILIAVSLIILISWRFQSFHEVIKALLLFLHFYFWDSAWFRI